MLLIYFIWHFLYHLTIQLRCLYVRGLERWHRLRLVGGQRDGLALLLLFQLFTIPLLCDSCRRGRKRNFRDRLSFWKCTFVLVMGFFGGSMLKKCPFLFDFLVGREQRNVTIGVAEKLHVFVRSGPVLNILNQLMCICNIKIMLTCVLVDFA